MLLVFRPQRILEEQRRLDEKRRVKRAANRKSASTSRARKKAYVDQMTAKNERMKQHALILSLLPDLVLAVCRSGEMTYVSPSSQWLLLYSPEEVLGANIFELVTSDCHPVLRKMISDNLSRPVQSQQTSTRKLSHSDGSEGGPKGSDVERTRESTISRGQLDGQRERFQAAQNAAAGSNDDRRGIARSASSPLSQPQGPKMLRLIRCDKTTVWCESRLSVRTTKNEGSANPTPLEIIITLRPSSEGSKTSTTDGIASTRVNGVECIPSSLAEDPDGFVAADDEGYECEVDEEESINSGSGNDSSSTVKRHEDGNGASSNKSDAKGSAKRRTEAKSEAGASCTSTEGREKLSSPKKRRRVSISSRLEEMTAVACEGVNKSASEDSFTGADTGDFTTQEGSGSSGSIEPDSNGEGSNNGSSKWSDGPGDGSRSGEFGGSEDGSFDGSSAAGTDLGDEVQCAVQSLILMGGQFGEGSQ